MNDIKCSTEYTKNEKCIIKSGKFKGQEFILEDLASKLFGGSWKDQFGNPACLLYALRVADEDLPLDDDVYYGKIGCMGHLIHKRELELYLPVLLK